MRYVLLRNVLLRTTFEEVQSASALIRCSGHRGSPCYSVVDLLIILITLLCFAGSAYAREATRLTDAQLDKVTAGVEGIDYPHVVVSVQ